jgi:hypothetical protein
LTATSIPELRTGSVISAFKTTEVCNAVPFNLLDDCVLEAKYSEKGLSDL